MNYAVIQTDKEFIIQPGIIYKQKKIIFSFVTIYKIFYEIII